MFHWVFKGLKTGIRTTRYPAPGERLAGISPGRPCGTRLDEAAVNLLAAACPTGAIVARGSGADVDYRHCIQCARCRRAAETPAMNWSEDCEWAALADRAAALSKRFPKLFGRSLHIRVVDAGACGACLSEARQLNNPYYNIHRLGFFITPTPREADVLLIAGPVTDAMRVPLRKAYEAMPEPKRVVAIGVCAISGGVFGPSFIAAGGAAEVVPVDIVVPGCPPPPLAILHGLLLAVERTAPAKLTSLAPQ